MTNQLFSCSCSCGTLLGRRAPPWDGGGTPILSQNRKKHWTIIFYSWPPVFPVFPLSVRSFWKHENFWNPFFSSFVRIWVLWHQKIHKIVKIIRKLLFVHDPVVFPVFHASVRSFWKHKNFWNFFSEFRENFGSWFVTMNKNSWFVIYSTWI